jgi:hypothetical protein
MFGRRALRNGFILAAVGLSAGCVDEQPTQPAVPEDDQPTAAVFSTQRGSTPRGLDAGFAQIARAVPGFGGMYVDRSGTLHVHVTRDRAAAPRGREELMSRLRPTLPAFGRTANGAQDVVFHDAEYDYLRLDQMRERMRGIFGVEGVVYTDIDELSNRLRVGVREGTPRERIEEALSRLGVPIEAVTIAATPVIQRLKGETLRDLVQPVGGGLQIVWEYPGVGFFLCTLGFNALRSEPGRSRPYFLTNSHCTGDQGVVTGTEYYQPAPPEFVDKYNLLGAEVLDPPFFTDPCYVGFVCRWSDAALVQYRRNVPVRFGTIYRTEFFGTTGPGSLEIARRGPKFFSIADERPFPLVGDIVDKMGRTTGWTRGEVIVTCADVLVSETNQVMLCQDLVSGHSAGGDSGSPVFQQEGNSRRVTLLGLLWGGGPGIWVFSSLENIRFELGEFRTN